jgi:hypothetical protein
MRTLLNAQASEHTFTQFIVHNKRNRTILYLTAVAVIIQFSIFKYLYPFANYIHGDSFRYLNGAELNLTINTYPIGYSKFLRLVSVFARPDIVLVNLQYLMIQCGTLFLLFSLFYFYKAGKWTQAILFLFMIVNPLPLYLANLVSSDGLFLALSMTWFSLLVWIIHKPSNKIIFWHAIVLFIAFTVRYNALIYPFIAAFAFWLSKLSLQKKITGLGLALLLCGWFVVLSMLQYKKLTGYWQYSPFSGWQLANNAIYVYREVDSADREPVPVQFRALDNSIRKFYRNNPHLQVGEANTAYMWVQTLPLMAYRDSLFKKDSSVTEFHSWANMGPFYSSYGLYILKKYPVHFLRNFVWPNSRKYLAPPLEYLEYYNWGTSWVPESVVKWFGYSNNQVTTRMKSNKVLILQYYPTLVSIINIAMFLMLASYILLKGWQFNTTFYKIILLGGFAWILNAGFTILVSSVALRFQAFPILLGAALSTLLIDWMAQLAQRMKLQSQEHAHEKAAVV